VRGLIIESPMVRDGFFYALGLGVVAALLWNLTHSAILLAIPLVLAAFFLWFFRDPSRTIPSGAGQIVSPADGVVTQADLIETPSGSRLRLSIFLSVFDVHVNRSPVSGIVKVVEFQKGQFMNAMKQESALHNEQTLIVIDAGGYDVSFRQIAGLLARRIVCNLKPGDQVERGQRMGLIKFGSRVDVLLPAEANLVVKIGSRVRGGASILAELPDGMTQQQISTTAVVA
jgi:phosphatidylserine decarboxylase